MDHAGNLASGLAALCGFGDPMGLGISATLFFVGLMGGLTHCGPMCGPFVLMQLPGGDSGLGSVRKLTAGALPAYHFGRMTTYVGLGAAAGAIGGGAVDLVERRWLLALPLALAAALFLYRALPLLPFRPKKENAFGTAFARLLARSAGPLLRWPQRAGFSPSGYALGILLGFLPCGLLYGALIAATATGGAVPGALAMGCFAIGTMPTLIAVGVAGSTMLARWRNVARAIAAPAYLVSAFALAGMALALII